MTTPVSSASTAPVAGAPAPTTSADPSIREAAEGFEGIFMSMLVEEMMKGTQVSEGNPLYAGLATQKLGDELAHAGGIGLAGILERQLGGGTTPTPGANP